jgi:hypothetical protein
MVSSILPKKRTELSILGKEHAQDSEFRTFFGRIEETIICFRNLLTFIQSQVSINLFLLDTDNPLR